MADSTDDTKKKRSSLNPLMNLLSNDKISLKAQLLSSFSAVALISGGITLGICLGLLFSLRTSSMNTAQSIIAEGTKSNLNALSKEIATAIDQQLIEVSQSENLVNAYYAQILLGHADIPENNSTLLATFPSYREYYFTGNCTIDCPSDYGIISGRSRLPFSMSYENGSLLHSSVFVYSSEMKRALRNDSDWAEALARYPVMQNVIDGLAYQDLDFNMQYTRGPNTTLMYYLSAKVTVNSGTGDYLAIHRIYPGILKSSMSYDPTGRPWFTDALEDAVHLHGPYKETLTSELAVTLSTKKSTTLRRGQRVEIVAAVVMLIQDVASIINKIRYTNNGFGALLAYGTNKVVVWKNRTDIFNYTTNTFKDLSHFDPVLAGYNLTYNRQIEYTDNTGKSWIVDVESFFTNRDTTAPRLTLLVFADKYGSETPLRSLGSSIDSTTIKVVTTASVLVSVVVGIVLIIVVMLVQYIGNPMGVLREIAKDIVRISGLGGDAKDYSQVMMKAQNAVGRSDEVGLLVVDCRDIIALLQAKSEEKQILPKYPSNPFYIKGQSNYGRFNWKQVKDLLRSVIQDYENRKLKNEGRVAEPTKKVKNNAVAPDIENGESTYDSSATTQMQSPTFLASLKFKLYALSAILLACLTATMIFTITSISTEGPMWAHECGSELEATQMQTLEAISLAKSDFSEVINLIFYAILLHS